MWSLNLYKFEYFQLWTGCGHRISTVSTSFGEKSLGYSSSGCHYHVRIWLWKFSISQSIYELYSPILDSSGVLARLETPRYTRYSQFTVVKSFPWLIKVITFFLWISKQKFSDRWMKKTHVKIKTSSKMQCFLT